MESLPEVEVSQFYPKLCGSGPQRVNASAFSSQEGVTDPNVSVVLPVKSVFTMQRLVPRGAGGEDLDSSALAVTPRRPAPFRCQIREEERAGGPVL